jgi:hypothetical protein
MTRGLRVLRHYFSFLNFSYFAPGLIEQGHEKIPPGEHNGT